MCKNGEKYVVDFACVKSCCIIILHKLTDIHWKASAGFSLHMDRVPMAYHRLANKAPNSNIALLGSFVLSRAISNTPTCNIL
jgi:hypothetical protein